MTTTRKPRHNWRLPMGWFALSTIVVISCCGCVEGKREGVVRHDPQTDMFYVTTVFWDIVTDNTADISHLLRLWEVRDQILTSPFPDLLGEPAILPDLQLFPGNRIAKISLSNPSFAIPTPTPWPIDLSRIVIRPGAFFSSDKNTLCYYHQADVPGSVVNDALVFVRPKLNAAVIELLSNELKRRREGGEQLPWDQFRLEAANFFAAPDDKRSQKEYEEKSPIQRSWLCLCDESSLRSLLGQAAANQLVITRNGTRIQIGLALSREDAHQLASTIDFVVKCVVAEVEKHERNLGDVVLDRSMVALLKSTNASVDVISHQVVVSLDVGPCLLFGEVASKPNAEKKTFYESTIAAIRGRGISISDSLALEGVVRSAIAGEPSSR